MNKGGNYIAVHVRRGDFVKYKQLVVSIEQISNQIKYIIKTTGINMVYLATDGTEDGRNTTISVY